MGWGGDVGCYAGAVAENTESRKEGGEQRCAKALLPGEGAST